MGLYRETVLHQRKPPFQNSTEALFYRANVGILADFDCFARYLKAGSSFEIVRANILIRGLQNKKAIERAYKEKLLIGEGGLSLTDFMNGRLSELPYLVFRGLKIYVPVFPFSLNEMYSKQWAKLAVSPYQSLLKGFEALTIDPFEYYGFSIYDSSFTKLVMIGRTDKEAAFYDYDAECLYFVNHQGRLDATLALFDEFLPYPQKTHMVQRLKPVAEAYFAFDEEKMLSSLVDNRLISGRLIHKATHKNIKPKPIKEEI